MNAAVVFFSYEGNTRRIADDLVEDLDATAIPLSIADIGTDPETYTWRNHVIHVSQSPTIQHPEFDQDEYGLIVLGTPVWSGSISPALRSFLDSQEFFRRRFALFCCYERRIGNALSDIRHRLKGNTIVDEARFCTTDRYASSMTRGRIREWAQSLLVGTADAEIVREEVASGRKTT